MIQTEYEFTLPKGYVDADGNVHKMGTIRLATAADEILPQQDPRVDKNPSYLVMILLSRVVTKLGDLSHINPKVIEGLFVEDLSFLEGLYNDINGYTNKDVVTCPECKTNFETVIKQGE